MSPCDEDGGGYAGGWSGTSMAAGVVSGVVRYPEGVAGSGGEISLTSRVFRNDGSSVCGLSSGVSHRATIDPAMPIETPPIER